MIASIYSNDWFGRSESDYTFNEREAMKGIVKLPNHKYSSFLYNEDRAERICSDKKLLHKEIIGMINALGLTNITVKLSDTNPTASTDGKFIEIGIGDEYKSISDCYEKIDRVIGMAIHESCHCLYTDFNYMRSICGSNPKLVHHIHNVIEDEIIEQKLIMQYPGYANFLNKLKYNIFETEYEKNEEEQEEDIDKVLQLLFFIIRYPKFISKIDEKILEKYETLFVQIKKIMQECNCFDISSEYCTRHSVDAAKKIYDLIIKNVDLPEDDEDDSSENRKSYYNPNTGDLQTMIIHILEEIYKNVSSESEQTDSNEVYVYHTNIEKAKEAAKDEYSWETIPETSIENNRDINIYNKYDRATYEAYKKEIDPYIEQAKRLIIQNKKKTEINTTKYARNGSLDATRLANAMCNEQAVFLRRTSKETITDAEYALVIMIDESGSMNSGHINELASKIAIMLYEAVSAYPRIQLFVYGHGDCVYKYLDNGKLNNKYVLGSRRQQMSQDEVRSYKMIVDDVKKNTKLPIVMFNITDSCYCSSEKKLAALVESLKEDKQKIFINLLALTHNERTDSNIRKWNDLIYGPGNWILYDSHIINSVFMSGLLKQMTKIIHKNCKL